jgi:integrase
MQIPITDGRENSHRSPWNKGKLIGSKPPLRTKDVWSIRTKLQVEHRIRDLAMFNLAIDSKLRGCDVVSLTVQDVAPNGVAIDRATVRQKKPGHPVRFELSEQTREAVDTYIGAAQEGRRIPVRKPALSWPLSHDQTVRPSHIRVNCPDRPGFSTVWHSLAPPYQSHAHLSQDRQPIPWHRGGRRTGHRRAGGCLNYLGQRWGNRPA